MVNPYAEKVKNLNMIELKKLGKVLMEEGALMPGLIRAPRISHLPDGSGLECYYWASFYPRRLAQAVRVRIRDIGTHACTHLGSLEEHLYVRARLRRKKKEHRI